MIGLSIEANNLLKNLNYRAFINCKDINNLKFDKKYNKLVECSVKDKIVLLFNSKRLKRDREVKQVLKNLVSEIEKLPEMKTSNLYTNPQLAKSLQTLFFEKVAKLENNPFSENSDKQVAETSKIRLTKSLQDYLSPELRSLRKQARLNPSLRKDEAHALERKVTKAKMAIQLGVGFKANSGATGSLIVTSVNGKPLGVFKPSVEHRAFKVRMKNLFEWIMHGQVRYLSPRHKAQPEAEVAASKLDRYFQFNLSPLSKIEEMGGRSGAFQVFLKGYNEAKDVLAQVDTKETFTKEEIHQFQMMAVFDYLLGNLDRHEENWFVKTQGTISKEIADLKCIDNANSFIRFNPNNLSRHWMGNQYKWKNLNMANTAFNDDVRNFIHRNLSQKNMKAFVAELCKALPDFLDKDMETHLLQRAAVLRRVASTDFYKPALLGQLTTDQTINDFLNGVPS